MLAGALSKVELGDEIPPDLYKAVAEVLVFVLRLSGRNTRSECARFPIARPSSFQHDTVCIRRRRLHCPPDICS